MINSKATMRAPLLDTSDLMAILKCSRWTIRRLVQAGELHALNVRKRCPRFDPVEVSRFIDSKFGLSNPAPDPDE